MSDNTYKIIGEICLVIPTILLTVFGVGEIVGGDISGVQHFFQLIPLLIIGVTAWFYPKQSGYTLLVCAGILAAIYVLMFARFPILTRLVNMGLLFGLPFISGISFIKGTSFKE